MTIVTSLFTEGGYVLKMFSVHTKAQKPAFSNSSGFKSVFEKFRFRDGFV